MVLFLLKRVNWSWIRIYALLVCMPVCLFLPNKRQNDWTDRAQILYGTSHDPRERTIKILKIRLRQNSIVIKFRKSTIFFLHISLLKYEMGASRSASLIFYILPCTNPFKKHLLLMTLLFGGKRCLISF